MMFNAQGAVEVILIQSQAGAEDSLETLEHASVPHTLVCVQLISL